MEVTGFILAGGKSSRMGTDKGLMDFNGQPMIQPMIDVLKELNIPCIIIANNDGYSQFQLPVINDVIKEKGPLGGIYTGLLNSNTEKNLFLTCDAPFITVEFIELMLKESNNEDVLFASYNGKRHPFPMVINKKLLPIVEDHLLSNDLKLSLVLEKTNQRIIEAEKLNIEKGMFNNLNTQEELKNNLS